MEKIHDLRQESERQALGLELKKWRARNGWNQRKAGEMMGVSRYTIMRIEAGEHVGWVAAYKVFARLAVALREEGETSI